MCMSNEIPLTQEGPLQARAAHNEGRPPRSELQVASCRSCSQLETKAEHKYACFCCWEYFERLEQLRQQAEKVLLIAEDNTGNSVQELIELPTLKTPIISTAEEAFCLMKMLTMPTVKCPQWKLHQTDLILTAKL